MDWGPPGSSVHGVFQARITKSELPLLPPGDLPDPGIQPESPGGKKKIHLPSRRPSGEGDGNPLQYPYLENPMDRGPCDTDWEPGTVTKQVIRRLPEGYSYRVGFENKDPCPS